MRRSPRLLSRRRAAGAFALVAAMLVCTASAQAADSWAAGKGLATATFMLGATTGPDGTMYVLGGVNGSGDLATAQTYTPTTGVWANLPSMSYFRSSEGVAVGGDGRIYAFGGNGGLASDPNGDTGELLATSEAYNPSTNKWQGVPALPTPRAGMATVGDTGPDGNGDVYVIGGWDAVGDGYLADNLRYDPSTNTWATMAPMPTPREYASAVVGSDGDIYVVGGMDSTGGLSTVEIYNPTTDHWTTGPSLATAEWGGSAAAVKNRIFVFGGYDDVDALALSDSQVLTIGGSSWGSDTVMLRARYLGAAAVSQTLKVWLFGGIGGSDGSTPLKAVDVFSSVDGTPPTGSVSIDSGQAATNTFTVNVTANATDTGSGVANVLISSKSTVSSNGLLSQGDEQSYVADTPISWDLTNATYGGTPMQGTRWVYVQWEDGAGNWSPVHSDSIYVDTIPPTITSGPSVRLLPNSVLDSGTWPVNVFWAGSDAGTTPPGYDLAQTCNAGVTWSSITLSPATVDAGQPGAGARRQLRVQTPGARPDQHQRLQLQPGLPCLGVPGERAHRHPHRRLVDRQLVVVRRRARPLLDQGQLVDVGDVHRHRGRMGGAHRAHAGRGPGLPRRRAPEGGVAVQQDRDIPEAHVHPHVGGPGHPHAEDRGGRHRGPPSCRRRRVRRPLLSAPASEPRRPRAWGRRCQGR